MTYFAPHLPFGFLYDADDPDNQPADLFRRAKQYATLMGEISVDVVDEIRATWEGGA